MNYMNSVKFYVTYDELISKIILYDKENKKTRTITNAYKLSDIKTILDKLIDENTDEFGESLRDTDGNILTDENGHPLFYRKDLGPKENCSVLVFNNIEYHDFIKLWNLVGSKKNITVNVTKNSEKKEESFEDDSMVPYNFDKMQRIREELSRNVPKKQKINRKKKNIGDKIISFTMAVLIATSIASCTRTLIINKREEDEIDSDIDSIIDTLENSDIDDETTRIIISSIEYAKEEAKEVINDVSYDDTAWVEFIESHEEIDENINEEIPLEIEEVNDMYTICLANYPRMDTEKYISTKNNYFDIISKYSSTYGVDPCLMLAIATQERGEHCEEIDAGGGAGLMQLQSDVWLGGTISAFNYDTMKVETIGPITEDMLLGLDTNIQIACMNFQNCLQNHHYDIPMAIQCYNYGAGNMKYITGDDNNIYDDNLYYDTSWLIWRDGIAGGDSRYLEHIFSYLPQDYVVNVKKNNGDIVQLKYHDTSLDNSKNNTK